MPDDSTSKKPSLEPEKIAKENKAMPMSKDKRIDSVHKEKAQKLNKENEEFGGQEGLDPTRFGDWEKGGRCTDF